MASEDDYNTSDDGEVDQFSDIEPVTNGKDTKKVLNNIIIRSANKSDITVERMRILREGGVVPGSIVCIEKCQDTRFFHEGDCVYLNDCNEIVPPSTELSLVMTALKAPVEKGGSNVKRVSHTQLLKNMTADTPDKAYTIFPVADFIQGDNTIHRRVIGSTALHGHIKSKIDQAAQKKKKMDPPGNLKSAAKPSLSDSGQDVTKKGISDMILSIKPGPGSDQKHNGLVKRLENNTAKAPPIPSPKSEPNQKSVAKSPHKATARVVQTSDTALKVPIQPGLKPITTKRKHSEMDGDIRITIEATGKTVSEAIAKIARNI